MQLRYRFYPSLQYLTLARNPVPTLAPALAADPAFLLGHAFVAWLYMLGTGSAVESEVGRTRLVRAARSACV